ncbi:oligoribonuclease [Branchiibius hedensis]|uniref:Oligoribonuclease n=1 Tax=Branchiibius hedensis TaxID=672460 RepID=A0A2Y8ZPS9_9MICO|nr:oligoribonuclease [Branchiibius hedensis]PWJ24569.1 oligoribonuclease [Branchiibius hedensis]SSA33386.1 oligoribonuclease [Branchiibius hedensis]
MPNDRAATDRIVWIDCEMTGLDLVADALIEIAVQVTDFYLEPVGPGIDIVIRPSADALAQMGEFVRAMHTDSGLLDELDEGVALAEAEEQVMEHLRQYAPEPGKWPLAGNTIGTDRAFLARDMPQVIRQLHYRVIDVSSIKELSRRWYPRSYFAAPAKHGGHRALADITESIAELRYYREAVFVAPPGPDTNQARALAQQFGVPAATERDGGQKHSGGQVR